MRSHARDRAGGRRASLLLALTALLAGCDRGIGPALPVARTIVLPDTSFRTLAVDSSGALWLGRRGELVVRDPTGHTRGVPVGGRQAPRVVGWMGGRAYVRSGDRVLVVEPGAGGVRAQRGDFGGTVLLPDVRGRYLYQAALSGAVLAHDPRSLEPVWAWASLGLPSTALAISPEGDRLYQALGSEEAAPRVLFRDLQTGRVLGATSFSDPFRDLAADRRGLLYGVVAEGGRGAVMALLPRRGGLELLWRTPLRRLDLPPGARLRLSPVGGRVAVFAPGNENGLRLLDAETGMVLGSLREGPRDAAFGPRGSLYLLYPGEVRVVR